MVMQFLTFYYRNIQLIISDIVNGKTGKYVHLKHIQFICLKQFHMNLEYRLWLYWHQLVQYLYYIICNTMDTNQSTPSLRDVQSYRFKFRAFRLFGVAAAFSAVAWYFKFRFSAVEDQRNKQIIKRVRDNTTVDLSQIRDISQLSELEGTRVKVTGELQKQRFIVKRQRGSHEGYIVLAPFIYKRLGGDQDFNGRTINLKYMVNLGWIPVEEKHRIIETVASDILEFDQLAEEYENDEDPPAYSTITAFIRRGEKKNIFKGYNNWATQQLYKYIDLFQLERAYAPGNQLFRHIYLQIIKDKEGEQDFPAKITNDTFIEELNNQHDANNKTRTNAAIGATVVSFGTALLSALL